MAKGNNINAARRCAFCNMQIQTIHYRKSKFKAGDLALVKFCKHCRKRSVPIVKELKKAN